MWIRLKKGLWFRMAKVLNSKLDNRDLHIPTFKLVISVFEERYLLA